MKNAVVITTDAGTFPPAAFLASRLSAMLDQVDVDIVVITPSADDAPHSTDRPLPFLLIHADADPRFQRVAAEFGPIRQISNYRLFLPAVFAGDYARILYLDTDTYVTDPRVFALLHLDMKGAPLAAVRDLRVSYSTRKSIRPYQQAAAGKDRKYLNAGVLLLDTMAFNQASILPPLIAMFERTDIVLRYSEQSALNRLLQGNWLELSPAFNMFPAWKDTFVWKAYPPAIIHFAGSGKPWRELRYLEIPHVQDELRDYLAQTPWQTFFNEQRTAREEARYAFLKPVIRHRLRFLWPVLRPFFRQSPFERLDWQAIARLLAAADFADVAAQITRPNLARIPRRLSRPSKGP